MYRDEVERFLRCMGIAEPAISSVLQIEWFQLA